MGLLCRVAWRRHLPIATTRRYRRGLCLAVDLGRESQGTRGGPRSQVFPIMSEPDDKNGLADSRLQRLLGGEQLASLRKRLRRRFERAPAERSLEHLRINRLAAEE